MIVKFKIAMSAHQLRQRQNILEKIKKIHPAIYIQNEETRAVQDIVITVAVPVEYIMGVCIFLNTSLLHESIDWVKTESGE